MSRPAPFAFFPYFGMVENQPCTTRTICFGLFKLLMHKLGMFEMLSRCFLESFHLQEVKTRHFIQAILFFGEKYHNIPAFGWTKTAM